MEDALKFEAPVNTSTFKNIVRILFEKKYFTGMPCLAGIEARQMPIIDLEALQEIEEMQRKLEREREERLRQRQLRIERGEEEEEEEKESEKLK